MLIQLGDKVLPAVVPYLQAGLRSDEESLRLGVCSGMAEILAACTRKQAEDYVHVLVPALKQALCDPALAVCQAAARAFVPLLRAIGPRAIDEIVPALLDELAGDNEDDAKRALQGLRELVALRPRDLLEVVTIYLCT